MPDPPYNFDGNLNEDGDTITFPSTKINGAGRCIPEFVPGTIYIHRHQKPLPSRNSVRQLSLFWYTDAVDKDISNGFIN